MANDAQFRVLLVDDHEIVRRGLRAVLQERPDISVVGEAGTMKAGLEEMDGRFRDVLLLNTVGELSYKDIAKRLKLPIGTVMSRLHRARLFLRKRLGPTFTLAV